MSRQRRDPRALALGFQAQHRERALEKQANARSDVLQAKRLAQLAREEQTQQREVRVGRGGFWMWSIVLHEVRVVVGTGEGRVFEK